MLGQHIEQFLVLTPRLIQRHLDQRWLRAIDLVECGEQSVKCLRCGGERFTHVCVRTGDIDLHHCGTAGGTAHGDAVILDAFVQIAALVVVGAGD